MRLGNRVSRCLEDHSGAEAIAVGAPESFGIFVGPIAIRADGLIRGCLVIVNALANFQRGRVLSIRHELDKGGFCRLATNGS